MCDEGSGNESTPPSDRPESPPKACAYCGAAIETSDWYPVLQRRNSDGDLEFYPFCSEACQESWRDE